MRQQGRVEREWVVPWLRTVVRHEALAVGRASRRQLLIDDEALDRIEHAGGAHVEDLCERLDRRARADRDLPRLKPDERRALGLLAAGYSYREICAITGWTYTKVNRCVTEGRRRLRDMEAERPYQGMVTVSVDAVA